MTNETREAQLEETQSPRVYFNLESGVSLLTRFGARPGTITDELEYVRRNFRLDSFKHIIDIDVSLFSDREHLGSYYALKGAFTIPYDCGADSHKPIDFSTDPVTARYLVEKYILWEEEKKRASSVFEAWRPVLDNGDERFEKMVKDYEEEALKNPDEQYPVPGGLYSRIYHEYNGMKLLHRFRWIRRADNQVDVPGFIDVLENVNRVYEAQCFLYSRLFKGNGSVSGEKK